MSLNKNETWIFATVARSPTPLNVLEAAALWYQGMDRDYVREAVLKLIERGKIRYNADLMLERAVK